MFNKTEQPDAAGLLRRDQSGRLMRVSRRGLGPGWSTCRNRAASVIELVRRLEDTGICQHSDLRTNRSISREMDQVINVASSHASNKATPDPMRTTDRPTAGL